MIDIGSDYVGESFLAERRRHPEESIQIIVIE
jgi:hypothetical protein